MKIGIVGAPNKGKSTLFSAMTEVDVNIADYPFTTIDANVGVAYLRVRCAHAELGLDKCDARGGQCRGGWRNIPVQLIDVAGLVPDAHLGRGKGNKFLDDLRGASALIQVVDASGRTDLNGKACKNADIVREVEFLQEEIVYWIAGVIRKNWPKVKLRGVGELASILSGLGGTEEVVSLAAKGCGLELERIDWGEEEVLGFSKEFAKLTKPTLIAANKVDVEGAIGNVEKLRKKYGEGKVVPCSAAVELGLRKAASKGAIKYVPGEEEFSIVGKIEPKQEDGLRAAGEFLKKNCGSGVQELLHKVVFGMLKMKVVYPVEDENRFSDHAGNVLPDALLVPENTTVVELAAKVHTSLARKFIGAIDAKSGRRIGKSHVLGQGAIVKIVSGK